MANSRFAYVRDYELPDPLLQGTFIILRIDGHAFKKSLIITPLFYPTAYPTPQIYRSPWVLEAQRQPRPRAHGSCRRISHGRVPRHRPRFWTVRRVQVSPYLPQPNPVRFNRRSPPISFLLRKSAVLYNRRRSKITSLLCSHFTSAYVMKWYTFFPDTPLSYPPSFDARIILYPGVKEVRDYFSWRQADSVFDLSCHCDRLLIAYQRT